MQNKNIILVNPVTNPSKTQIKEQLIQLVPDGIKARLQIPSAPSSDNEAVRLLELNKAIATLQEYVKTTENALLNAIANALNDIESMPLGVRKGDIIVFNGTEWVVKSSGLNGAVLTIDTTAIDGTDLSWIAPGVASLPAYIKDELNVGNTIDRHKVFTYSGDNVSRIDIYEDNTLAVHLYQIDFTYSGDNVSSITYERISDATTWTKTFAYDINDNITTITIT